jgi:hypothetical protein
MLLITCIIIILIEAVTEGLLKRLNSPINEIIFDAWIQWVIALMFFGSWFIWAIHFDGYYVPTWKIITGFVFVRFAIFDVIWNISRGVKWNYYGTTKLYDRIMFELAEYGWMLKAIAGIIGICFLLGWE